MSDSEEEVVIVPMPRHRIRFTDMPVNLQEKAIRCKKLEFRLTSTFSV
jgi:hypothetical protein